MKSIHVFLLCLLAIVPCCGCGSVGATLFVNNTGSDAYVVEIDGVQEKSSFARKHKKWFVPYGEHHIKVRTKDSVVFEGTKLFEPHADGPAWRHYILDPTGKTKYAVHEVYYYNDTETANKSKHSSRRNGLPRGNWIDVPTGAFAFNAMPVVFVSGDKEKETRLSVWADKPKKKPANNQWSQNKW